ncbi:hypothetical protein C8R43DRAFT_994115 [Mycena crocata]|nr:hypothetical protein C8R43DRAFT_994115 [Mycena crocata]
MSSSSCIASSRASTASSASAPKDYAAAFASLQSTYGVAGRAPSVCSKQRSVSSNKQKSPAAQGAYQSIPTGKNYGSAFGALSSQFGFGGAPAKSPHV